MNSYTIDELSEGVLKGNRRMLAKAISLVESTCNRDIPNAQRLLERVLPFSGKAYRLGITGVPGVGKSTFIESLGLNLIEKGHKIAVLAIDPSSERSGGSILGDKTRMVELGKRESAFIRPSPSSGSLGGVARKTRESILLCEAAGFDVVFVETVGVGQSEVLVSSMVDFLLLLLLPNAGDELQGIKRGIMEIADAIVIHKADGEQREMAQIARSQIQSVLFFLPPREGNWMPRVTIGSALQKDGLEEVWQICRDFFSRPEIKETRRANQSCQWVHKLVQEKLHSVFYHNPAVRLKFPALENAVLSRTRTPTAAAVELLQTFREHFNAEDLEL